MKKVMFAILIGISICCICIKEKHINKPLSYTLKIQRIDSLNTYYILYLEKGDSIYKAINNKDKINLDI